MREDKVRTFMELAGQTISKRFDALSESERKLGAQLLLSEVLEYVVAGLGVTPEVDGVQITDPNGLSYSLTEQPPDQMEMLDGLSDVAYTMYWNALAFGLPLEQAFDLVCDNNLSKFVLLPDWGEGEQELPSDQWDCKQGIEWPSRVSSVQIVNVDGSFYAVGKDKNGKVCKPSSFAPVDLSPMISAVA